MTDEFGLDADIKRGVTYLNLNHIQWWERVDVATLDMTSMRFHILAQITGKLLYETDEAIMRSHAWRARHGFSYDAGEHFAGEWNAIWIKYVRIVQGAVTGE